MANINNRESRNRETATRLNTSNPPANVTGTNEINPNRVVNPQPTTYEHGYLHGRVAEERRNADLQEVRDNDNAARGLLLGILLTSLIGIPLAALFYLTQRDQTPAPINRTIVVPSPAPSQSPQVQERIIERDRVVPIPQAPAPRVDVTIPNPAPQQQAPASQAAPATTDAAPTDSSSQTVPSTQSGTSASPSQSGSTSGDTTSTPTDSSAGSSTGSGSNQ